jgi:chaperone required for assembly of F1-ATPase
VKRFYRLAASIEKEGGFGVTLDQRPLKTPAKRELTVPSAKLAAALAEEWQAQGEKIEPATMPLMQLVSTALDRIAEGSGPLLDILAGFGRTDLLCYRAAHPRDLVARQQQLWQPWLDWAETLGIALVVTEGLVPVEQPAASLSRLRQRLERYDFWVLTALQSLVPSLGSVILALAVVEGALDAEQAFALSQLDETFQAERWGLDQEAVRRQEGLRREILAAARFLALLTAA